MSDEKMRIVKAFRVGTEPDSVVVTIPADIRKKLKIGRGDHFKVAIDDKGRIVYDVVK